MAAHHIFGKKNYALRYDVRNGICLLNSVEHMNGIHSDDPIIHQEYSDKIRECRVEDWDYLVSLRHVTTPQFDWDAKEAELKELLTEYQLKLEGL